MTTATAEPTTSLPTAAAPPAKSRIGLLVFGAIASGLLLGLVLVLAVFGGGREHEITGAALFALGSGFVLLAVGSTRFSDQPQRWALAPGVAAAVVGLAMWLFSPSEHTLALAGWVWPGLLLVLVGWSFRGARRSLHSWARPALLYPALVVLLFVAVGGRALGAALRGLGAASSAIPPPGMLSP
jgi:hypothetical protein